MGTRFHELLQALDDEHHQQLRLAHNGFGKQTAKPAEINIDCLFEPEPPKDNLEIPKAAEPVAPSEDANIPKRALPLGEDDYDDHLTIDAMPSHIDKKGLRHPHFDEELVRASPSGAVSNALTTDSSEYEVPTFELRPQWNRDFLINRHFMMSRMLEDTISRHTSFSATARSALAKPLAKLDFRESWTHWRENRQCFAVMHPSSTKRLLWDIVSLLCLSYDFAMIPLQAFEIEGSTFQEVIDIGIWFIRGFWTLDIPFSFRTGFYRRGRVVVDPWQVARHYLHHWFFLDVVIVSADWLTLLMDSADSMATMGKSLRVLRLARVIRLLRIVKVMQIGKAVLDRVDSEKVAIYLHMSATLILIMGVCHVTACTWYGLSVWFDSDITGGITWVSAAQIKNESAGYLYSTSLHWSLTQFTPASMDIQPVNTIERIYAIVVVILGLVVFSSFISGITSSATQLRKKMSESTKELWLLRRFLKQAKISRLLSFRIQRYIEYVIDQEHSVLKENQVKLLDALSAPLRNELNVDMHEGLLLKHEFLARFCHEQSNLVVWNGALTTLPLALGDVVFFTGEPAHAMMGLSFGELEYKRKRDVESIPVGRGSWFSEATLWTTWSHVGDMRTKTVCTLVAIDAMAFIKNVTAVSQLARTASSYARSFIADLNELGATEITDLTFR